MVDAPGFSGEEPLESRAGIFLPVAGSCPTPGCCLIGWPACPMAPALSHLSRAQGCEPACTSDLTAPITGPTAHLWPPRAAASRPRLLCGLLGGALAVACMGHGTITCSVGQTPSWTFPGTCLFLTPCRPITLQGACDGHFRPCLQAVRAACHSGSPYSFLHRVPLPWAVASLHTFSLLKSSCCR